MNQGDDGESLFVLVEGLLEVSIQIEGEKKHLTFLRPGSFLGEMALLTGEKTFSRCYQLYRITSW